MWLVLLSAFLLVVASSCGGWLSYQYRHSPGEYSPLWLYGTSVLSTTSWVILTRSAYKLSTVAVFFDVTAAALYLLAFVCLGETLTPLQTSGAVLALVGLALMSS